MFLQVFDPEAFGGRAEFLRQTDDTIDRCHACPPIDPENPVRLPGEMAQRRIREAEEGGIELPAKVLEALASKAAHYGVSLPGAL